MAASDPAWFSTGVLVALAAGTAFVAFIAGSFACGTALKNERSAGEAATATVLAVLATFAFLGGVAASAHYESENLESGGLGTAAYVLFGVGVVLALIARSRATRPLRSGTVVVRPRSRDDDPAGEE